MSEDGVVVFGGVDTHRDTHVGAVVDSAGRLLGSESFTAQRAGYQRMVAWFRRAIWFGLGWKGQAATAPAWLAI